VGYEEGRSMLRPYHGLNQPAAIAIL